MTGNGGPAAALPGTPHHLRPGAAIDDLICSLEEEWKVGLKIRGAEWSPKTSNANDTPDRICALVKFLFYTARPALYHAIDEFKSLAPSLTSEERLGLLREILSSTKESQLDPRGRTPKNEPPKSLAASLRGKYALAIYVLQKLHKRFYYFGIHTQKSYLTTCTSYKDTIHSLLCLNCYLFLGVRYRPGRSVIRPIAKWYYVSTNVCWLHS
jgi:hypothetical protein